MSHSGDVALDYPSGAFRCVSCGAIGYDDVLTVTEDGFKHTDCAKADGDPVLCIHGEPPYERCYLCWPEEDNETNIVTGRSEHDPDDNNDPGIPKPGM